MNFQLGKLGKGIALASFLTASGGVLAAEQGTLGETSTGKLDVLVDIADRVQISGLNDIDLGTYTGTGDLVGDDSFCVYRNGTGAYKVTVSSENADGGTFRVSNGTDHIAYSVKYNDTENLTSGQELSATGHATSVTCGGSDNATLEVRMLEAALQAAPTGDFSDTITLYVQAE